MHMHGGWSLVLPQEARQTAALVPSSSDSMISAIPTMSTSFLLFLTTMVLPSVLVESTRGSSLFQLWGRSSHPNLQEIELQLKQEHQLSQIDAVPTTTTNTSLRTRRQPSAKVRHLAAASIVALLVLVESAPRAWSNAQRSPRPPLKLPWSDEELAPVTPDGFPPGYRFNPSWQEIMRLPVPVDTQEQFDGLSVAKRVAIVSRVSVLHLTLLSCLGPLVMRGALRAASGVPWRLTPGLALLFCIQTLSYHIVHNLLNDWQDLDDDDAQPNALRLAYGCHALAQGFLSKRAFLKLMAVLFIPGAALSIAFIPTVLGPAALYGILALFLYTIVFKPLAMGEVLIYLVWGPLMAGYGQLAAGADFVGWSQFFLDPAAALFGLSALSVIMGKHTDKIGRSTKRTLPALLGHPAALVVCAATIVGPHILLGVTLLRDYVLKVAPPQLPMGASLAFLTLLREVPTTLRILRRGSVIGHDRPPLTKNLVGILATVDVDRAWPLWFVSVTGWHAITFGYLLVLGSGLEWVLRALYTIIP